MAYISCIFLIKRYRKSNLMFFNQWKYNCTINLPVSKELNIPYIMAYVPPKLYLDIIFHFTLQ